jgi:hypothetical protein
VSHGHAGGGKPTNKPNNKHSSGEAPRAPTNGNAHPRPEGIAEQEREMTQEGTGYAPLIDKEIKALCEETQAASFRPPQRRRARSRRPDLDQRMEQRPQAVRVDQTADQILNTLATYCQRINDSQH